MYVLTCTVTYLNNVQILQEITWQIFNKTQSQSLVKLIFDVIMLLLGTDYMCTIAPCVYGQAALL